MTHIRPESGSISRSSFAIVANGFADGPAQALRDYLVEHGARVVVVWHPLTREQGTIHVVAEYAGGDLMHRRSFRVPLHAPLSYAADTFVPLRLPRVDVWFGFNPLACARGLLQQRLGRAEKVVLWSVDFVPDRFGRGTLPTKLYDALDRQCCLRAHARVELSEAARLARNTRHRLGASSTPTQIVPMGAWLQRVPTTRPDGYKERRIVFLGHLVPRQGVAMFLDALRVLHSRGDGVVADVIGTGPDEAMLRERAKALGLEESVRFHGFLPDHRDVERQLAASSIAVAPFEPSDDSFTRHADPGKLKAYLAAGLPVVLTDVPPNAHELVREAGAQVVAYKASALAGAIVEALSSPERWRERHERALRYASRFDWNSLLGDALTELGFRLD